MCLVFKRALLKVFCVEVVQTPVGHPGWYWAPASQDIVCLQIFNLFSACWTYRRRVSIVLMFFHSLVVGSFCWSLKIFRMGSVNALSGCGVSGMSGCLMHGMFLDMQRTHEWSSKKGFFLFNKQDFFCFTQCAHLVDVKCCWPVSVRNVSAFATCSDVVGCLCLISCWAACVPCQKMQWEDVFGLCFALLVGKAWRSHQEPGIVCGETCG